MAEGGDTLRRMIAANGADEDSAISAAPGALDLACGKAARRLFDVKAGAKDARVAEVSLAGLLESRPDPSLLVLIEEPGGRRGLLTIDAMLINALVELSTGAGDRQVYRKARKPTGIDAALVREFSTLLLDLFLSELAEATKHPAPPGLSLGAHEVDPVRLSYTLGKGTYGVVAAEISFQDGIRGGGVSIALPAPLWTFRGPAGRDRRFAAMARILADLPLKLRVVLEKAPLPLDQALALRIGDHLPVSAAALSDLTLVAADGTPVLKGRLGQKSGRKAVSVSEILVSGGEFAARDRNPEPAPPQLPNRFSPVEPGEATATPPVADNG